MSRKGVTSVKFSLYSEIQSWPGKSAEQLYGEVLEQIVRTPTGSATTRYAVIEHFFFPKFSVSANPLGALRGGGAADDADQLPDAAARRCRTTTRSCWPPRSRPPTSSLGGRYEFGVGRGHGWIPPKAGVPLAESRATRYEESRRAALRGARERALLARRQVLPRSTTRGIVPRADRKFRVFLGGTSRPHVRARRGRAAGPSSCRRSCPTRRSREQLDLYRAKCAEHGNEPDIVWIHACYLDEDRDIAMREAESWMVRLPRRATPRR